MRFVRADNADLSTGDIDFTIQAWVNMESKLNMGIVLKDDLSPREYRLDFNADLDRFRFFVFDSGNSVAGTVSANNLGSPSTGTWYHIVCWHDSVNNLVGIAVNAGTPNTAATTGAPSDQTAVFEIGGFDNSSLQNFDGLIAAVAFWKRVLSDDERTELYNNGNGRSYAYITTPALTLTDRQEISDVVRRVHYRTFADNLRTSDADVLGRFIAFADRQDASDQARMGRAQSVVAFDRQDFFDARQALRIARLAEQQRVSDVATQQRLSFAPVAHTQAASAQVAIQDDVFLSHLMRDLRAIDAIQFTEAVVVSLLTRDLRFTDNFNLSDAALVEKFGEEIEAILAGIRTFTCTPGYDLQREAITKTGVADFDQPGLFSVANGAARPAYKFVINIPALTKIQADSMSAFHFVHQGGKAFYIDGFQAWSFVSTLNLIGEGNGVRKEFFLPNRNIDPDSLTVAVFDGATHSITTAFSLVSAAAGLISFATAPSSGDDIEASHAHKYKVVFDPDGFKLDEFASGVFRAQLKLRELAV